SLVGAQYGAACLPEQVEFSEFLTVLRVCQEMGFSSEVLEQCYRQDENTIPPSFCLQSQHVHHKYNSQPGQKIDKNGWDEVLAKGRKILNDVITQCVLEGNIDQEHSQKYFRSRLEKDLHFALDGQSGADIKRGICYVYKTGKKADQRKKGNEPLPEDQDQMFRLSQLCDNFLPNLVRTQQALIYTSTNNTSTPKAGGKVLKVIVEPDEEHFYTTDGSEQVWKWTVLGGKVEGHLLHQGPVESLTLSSDGVYMVTIASGDIYVWNTSTPENIYRIHGSQASHILITPK
ncbi:hypothetical protein QTP70_034572, partial [Hemibagrus guttatus]